MPSKKKDMPYSWEMVVEANRHGTVEDLDLALLSAFEESEKAYEICVDSARVNATLNNKVDRLEYLLDEGHIDMNKIGPASVASSFGDSSPKDLAAMLVSRGWDINQIQPTRGTYHSPASNEFNKKLIQLVCRDEEMVRWCLDKGATIEQSDETLLADVASFGSIDTCRILLKHGAPISESTLHNAAWRGRPEMVTYLVDEVGLDVNKVYQGRHEPMLQHRTPLCSAVISPFLNGPGEVVKILLERGADPCLEGNNAFDEAKSRLMIDILNEWKHRDEKTQEEPKAKRRKTSKQNVSGDPKKKI